MPSGAVCFFSPVPAKGGEGAITFDDLELHLLGYCPFVALRSVDVAGE